MDVDKRVELVEYDDGNSLEQQLREQIGGVHSANTLLLHLPRYEFHTPLNIFDQKELMKNIDEIFSTEQMTDDSIRKRLSADSKKMFDAHELTTDAVHKIIKKFKKDYRTTFQPGKEKELLEEIVAIKDMYVAVAHEILKIKKDDTVRFEKNGFDIAGNIVGTREFGRLLRRIQFEGRILNITNPLDTTSYVLCASSGLSPERVLGFRHNDIERCKAFLKDKMADEPLNLETLIGLHHRGWLIDESVLPFNVQHEAANIWISRHVKAAFSWDANSDTAVSMVLLLGNMFRKSDELAGISWYHASQEETRNGAYISGCTRLNEKKIFPSTEMIHSSVKDIEEKLTLAGKNDLALGIKCEEEFLKRLNTRGILNNDETLSKEAIKSRQLHSMKVLSRLEENPFYILGFQGQNVFLYDDEGKRSSIIEHIGTVNQIVRKGRFVYALTSTAKRNEGLEYSIVKIEPSIDGVTIKDRFSIRKDSRLHSELQKEKFVDIFHQKEVCGIEVLKIL